MTISLKTVKTKYKKVIKAILPASGKIPSVGRVDFGDLRRLQPIDPHFGFSRGTVIDRYYIEKFLAAHTEDVRGRVLELGDSTYTKRFGGSQVRRAEVLHYEEGNPQATIVGDLTKADNLESNSFDCIILTQTLQMIYDARAAVQNLYRILKPSGVLLVTSHGTSKVSRFLGVDPWGEYWHFTSQSLQILFSEFFQPKNVSLTAYGNVLAAAAFLYGLAAQELTPAELDYHDPHFEVIVAARASK